VKVQISIGTVGSFLCCPNLKRNRAAFQSRWAVLLMLAEKASLGTTHSGLDNEGLSILSVLSRATCIPSKGTALN